MFSDPQGCLEMFKDAQRWTKNIRSFLIGRNCHHTPSLINKSLVVKVASTVNQRWHDRGQSVMLEDAQECSRMLGDAASTPRDLLIKLGWWWHYIQSTKILSWDFQTQRWTKNITPLDIGHDCHHKPSLINKSLVVKAASMSNLKRDAQGCSVMLEDARECSKMLGECSFHHQRFID